MLDAKSLHNLLNVMVFVELLACVGASCFIKNRFTTGMSFLKLGKIENVTVNNDPKGVSRIVFLYFLKRDEKKKKNIKLDV